MLLCNTWILYLTWCLRVREWTAFTPNLNTCSLDQTRIRQISWIQLLITRKEKDTSSGNQSLQGKEADWEGFLMIHMVWLQDRWDSMLKECRENWVIKRQKWPNSLQVVQMEIWVLMKFWWDKKKLLELLTVVVSFTIQKVFIDRLWWC